MTRSSRPSAATAARKLHARAPHAGTGVRRARGRSSRAICEPLQQRTSLQPRHYAPFLKRCTTM
eukprot:8859487-Lingulodinium_polyedra.AAC.1